MSGDRDQRTARAVKKKTGVTKAEATKTAATIARLEKILEHKFSHPQNITIIAQALNKDQRPPQGLDEVRHFQRLEFLGDRVLALACAEMLTENFPQENEGALTKRFVAFVCNSTLEDIFHASLQLQKENLKDWPEKKSLADLCEACLAALYLDAGLEAVKIFLIKHGKEKICAENAKPPHHDKTELQEWLQTRGQAPPRYHENQRKGPDHAPLFSVTASTASGWHAQAQANSKQSAEARAAQILLAKLRAAEADRKQESKDKPPHGLFEQSMEGQHDRKA